MSARSNTFRWAVISLLLVITCSRAFAAKTLYVDDDGPADFNNIQAAIDASADGDTVLVAPGTYTGDGNRDINFTGKTITVKSENGAQTCIIDCQGSEEEQHRGFNIYSEKNTYATLDGFTIINGCVDDNGGAVLCGNNALVRNCVITNNNAEYGGGIYAGESIIVNCIITFNKAHRKGGGIYATRGSPFFINCTIVGNRAFENGGGIACGVRGTTTMTNCIIVGNRASLGNQIFAHNEGKHVPSMRLKARNCCIQSDSCADITHNPCMPWAFGATSLLDLENVIYNSNPQFVNPYQADFRLHPNSPCVDAGTNPISIELPPTDIDGNPRITDGNRDGTSLPDMGAHEVLNLNQPYIWVSKSELEFVAVADGSIPESQTLNIQNLGLETLYWSIQNDCNWLQVTPNRGSSEPTSIDVAVSVDNLNLEPGKYKYDLTISDENALNSPQIIPVKLYLTKTLHVPDEYTTIQEAIDAANPYDTILIADGIYQDNNNQGINLGAKQITLLSENGSDECIIDTQINLSSSGDVIIFDNKKDSNIILDGLTIKCIRCDSISPTIRNCNISNNGTITGVELCWSDTCIENCVISACSLGISCQWSYPMLLDCTLQNNDIALSCNRGSSPQLYSCDINENTERAIDIDVCYGSQIIDCRITGNKWDKTVPAVTCSRAFLTIDNCIVSGNSSGFSFFACGDIVIKNCVISCNGQGNHSAEYGIYLENGNLLIENSTLVGNGSAGLYCNGSYWRPSYRVEVTNSILWANEPNQISGNIDLVNVNYSNIQNGLPGQGNIDDNPLFAALGYWNPNSTPEDPNDDFWVEGDYHLKSQAGRWDPNSQSWVQDAVTSPGIDSGDPNNPIGHEPFPNGGIINIGAYGGTIEASKSYFGGPVCETIIAGDINGDCKVDFKDFAILASHWLEER